MSETEMTSSYRLYIAVLDEVPDHIVPTLVAHSVLWAQEKMSELPTWKHWREYSFRKVVLRVSRKEFEKIQALKTKMAVLEGHENKTLGGTTSCLVIEPTMPADAPNVLRFAKMWTPSTYES